MFTRESRNLPEQPGGGAKLLDRATFFFYWLTGIFKMQPFLTALTLQVQTLDKLPGDDERCLFPTVWACTLSTCHTSNQDGSRGKGAEPRPLAQSQLNRQHARKTYINALRKNSATGSDSRSHTVSHLSLSSQRNKQYSSFFFPSPLLCLKSCSRDLTRGLPHLSNVPEKMWRAV